MRRHGCALSSVGTRRDPRRQTHSPRKDRSSRESRARREESGRMSADDRIAQLALERSFHLAAESAIDIANMIASDRGLRKPTSYRDVFRVLSEAGILTTEVGERFQKIAGLRNVLVHDYARVDAAELRTYACT
ncbi:MAG: type VII toxin-antitoxin system HepT family RNase toxin [Thermoplasmatota archaeon]